MEIQHNHTEKGGRFYIDESGDDVTELVYKMDGPAKMVIEHTEVAEKHEGKGIGKKLVNAAVEYARSKHIKILPMCPFAKAVMQKVDDYYDVLIVNY